MKKIIIIDGGPRKTFNTASMLKKFAEGASSVSEKIEVKYYRLYDIDYKAQTLNIDNEIRHLSSREAAILNILIQNCDNVVSSHRMLMDIWGDDSYYNLRSMNVFVSKLRSYLSKDKRIDISSIRGVGYRLSIRE